MSDIEIAKQCKPLNILDVAKKIGISSDNLICYGDNKAKVKVNGCKKNSKLILVSAITPTPMGEGKTTVSIGLSDALNKLHKKVVLALREASLGPVFGIKGGATGGGYSQVIPMDEINLHFTGDFHAITTANNLIAAAIDNHIEHGNKLNISQVVFERCLDINDRSLRSIKTKYGTTSFNITAASEVMTSFCLSTDINDLKERLGNIIIGYNNKKECIYVKDLNIVGSLLVLLKDAFLPNLVQTLESTPTFIHGGPFANIAHGCNSVVATKMALSYGDYVVTEAGFGSDLGALKFCDIKCREAQLKPDCVVLVATIKALKYQGGLSKEEILNEDNEALERGFNNLMVHYQNMKKLNSNVIVCLNKFSTDSSVEIEMVEKFCNNHNIPFSVNNSYSEGGRGSIELAKLVLNELENDNKFNYLYDVNLPIKQKIDIIAKEIYRANDVSFSQEALEKIDFLEHNNLFKVPICVSKTQYSLSDDADNRNIGGYNLYVRDVKIYNGAGFITILLGNVVTMPGLPKIPNYEKIDLINNEIVGLS